MITGDLKIQQEKSDEEFKIVIEKIRKDILKLKNGLDKR